MYPKTKFNDRQGKILRDRLRHVPDSLGKRFIKIHSEAYGYKAFEAFWDKMRYAFMHGDKTISLDDNELRSLAEALAPQLTRRASVGIMASLVVALGGIVYAASKLERHASEDKAKPTFMEFLGQLKEALGVPLCITTTGAIGMAGGAIWYNKELDKLVADDKKLGHLCDLTASLDQMFHPVELALKETIVKRGEKKGMHR